MKGGKREKKKEGEEIGRKGERRGRSKEDRGKREAIGERKNYEKE